MIGAGVSVAQTGVTLLSGKELRSFELASFDDVVTSAHESAASLHLKQVDERETPNRVWLRYRYGPGNHSLEVDIRRQTDHVTSIIVRVGSKSQRGLGALFLRDLYHELLARDAYFEPWTGEDSRPIEF